MENEESSGLRFVLEAVRAGEAAGGDIERYCHILVKKLTELGAFAVLGLVRDNDRRWERVAAHSTREGLIEALTAMVGGNAVDVNDPSVAGTVARTGRLIRLDDIGPVAAAQDRFPTFAEIVRHHELRAYLCVPIGTQGAILGTLAVGRCGADSTPFTDDEVRTLELVASAAAAAITSARMVRTEQRLREALSKSNERIRVASRTEVVGRLVAGVGHDLNNVFSVVVSYGEMLIDDIDDPALREDLAEVRLAGERGGDLVRQMLAFGRHEVASPRVVDVPALVTSMRPMLKRILFEDTDLVFDVDPGAGSCRVDPSHFEQVVLDLALHARDSMAAGGRIEVCVSPIVVDDPRSRRAGPHVLVSMRSSGELGTVDPFFSASPGTTDLGLTAPRNLMARYGGALVVRVDATGDVVFELLFPRSDPASPRVAAAVTAGPSTAAVTVLVVDDDAPLRKVVSQILTRAGQRVLEAADGLSALEVLAAEEVDVLLADVVMPGMSGYELAERARALRPSLAVVTMSGYPPDVTRSRLGSASEAFLAKPIVVADLVEVVRGAAAARDSAGGRGGLVP